MTAATHTAGPWVVAHDPSYPNEPAIDAVIDGQTYHLALVHVAPGPDEVTHANAAVMAAAPRMLAKLRDVAGECGECSDGILAFDAPLHARKAGDPCPACEDIRDLIALAEGRRS